MKKKYVWLALLALALAAVMPLHALAAQEQVVNGGFEEGQDGLPTGWSLYAWHAGSDFSDVQVVEEAGNARLYIHNYSSNDVRLYQSVSVQPNCYYKVSCRAKVAGVTQGLGANLSVLDTFAASEGLLETHGQWQELTLYLKTGEAQTEINLAVGLGGYAADSMGEAWLDDVALEPVDAIPEGAVVQSAALAERQGDAQDVEEEPEDNPAKLGPEALLVSLIYALAAYLIWRWYRRQEGLTVYAPWTAILIVGMALALAARVALACLIYGYPNDIACWMGWSEGMVQNGPWHFYERMSFADYPPGYMVVLWALGGLRLLLGIGYNTTGHLLLVKIVPILCDLGLAFVLYRVARPRSAMLGVLLALFYLFNPAVLTDSAAWGQVDAVVSLLAVAYLWLIYKEKNIGAGALLAVGVMMKPQMLLFAPLMIVGWVNAFRQSKGRGWRDLVGSAVAGLAAMLVFVVPFTGGQPWYWIVEKLFSTMGSYAYGSVNAANLMALLDGLWRADSDTLLLLSYKTWGYIGIALAVGYALVLALRDKKREHLFFYAALLIAGIFTLGNGMHERYAFPVLGLLLVSCALQPRTRQMGLYLAFTVCQSLNIILVLANQYLPMEGFWTPLASGLTVITFAAMACLAWQISRGQEDDLHYREKRAKRFAKPEGRAPIDRLNAALSTDRTQGRMTAWDHWLCLVITLVYAVVAILYLGSTRVPESMWTAKEQGQSIVVDLGESQTVEDIWMYRGLCTVGGKLAFEISEDGQAWAPLYTLNIVDGNAGADQASDLYKWFQFPDVSAQGRYVRLTAEQPLLRILEIAFINPEGQPIGIQQLLGEEADLATASKAFDEQDRIPERPSFYNSTYFDEIYHARTAWEHWNRLEPYETTHPPLGKVIIMMGIALFGMNPFGWRIMGALFGILMVPVMYRLGKEIFKDTRFAFLATVLLTFDFMHYTQTRIATIDSYAVFFIMCMFLCMYRFYQSNYLVQPLRKALIPLGLSGLFFGLGAASKWICIYAGGGLAVIFFYCMVLRYREYAAVKAGERGDLTEEQAQQVLACYNGRTMGILAFCVLAFIIVPVGIYIASYIPYMMVPGKGHDLVGVWNNQLSMFRYHSTLKDSHFFASPWYQWPLILKPTWFYQAGNLPQGMVGTIGTLGNPAVWWVGTVAMAYMLVTLVRERGRDKVALFIALGFAAQFLPWVLVPRSTFIYHYFASTPFFILAIVWSIRRLLEHKRLSWKAVWVYGAVVVLLFVAFYPVLSGLPIPVSYARLLKWMPTWYFIPT